MVTIAALWLPIILSSIIVWLASALVWTVSPHHKTDFAKLPDEDAARAGLTPQDIPPGQYTIPHMKTQAEMQDAEMIKKMEEGPNAFVTIVPKGVPTMGGKLAGSFTYNLVVAIVIAYLTSRIFDAGTTYWPVFRVVGTVTWLAYGMAYVQDCLWFGRPWNTFAKLQGDALLYGLLTAGTFAGFWPEA